MRIGIGLPAAIPDVDAAAVGEWAVAAERLGFASVSVIDRLVYDSLDPLIALAAAAARTGRVELMTTVLNAPLRRNAVVLAKQLGSLDRLSSGRLTVGVGLGGWPQDREASELPPGGMGALLDGMLSTMRRVWHGEVRGASGPIPALPPGRPGLLFGGLAPASFKRMAAAGDGWVAPSFGFEPLVEGIAAARAAWSAAGRPGRPRIVAVRCFSLGERAEETADHYLAHYYGAQYFDAVRADTLTTPRRLEAELARLADAGCDDVVLLPCSDGPDQPELLAGALDGIGAGRRVSPARRGHTGPDATNPTALQLPGAAGA
jgi:alkanesulfonate monooxygenase SsuD/methylene tetrahydromethanopterin reductase-like flavin-dependent oxidoreductase (luciferase family)